MFRTFLLHKKILQIEIIYSTLNNILFLNSRNEVTIIFDYRICQNILEGVQFL